MQVRISASTGVKLLRIIQQQSMHKGEDVASLCESETSDSPKGRCASDTDTDIDAQMQAPAVVNKQPTPSGMAKE